MLSSILLDIWLTFQRWIAVYTTHGRSLSTQRRRSGIDRWRIFTEVDSYRWRQQCQVDVVGMQCAALFSGSEVLAQEWYPRTKGIHESVSSGILKCVFGVRLDIRNVFNSLSSSMSLIRNTVWTGVYFFCLFQTNPNQSWKLSERI